ncbi:MAG: helix-turn-helix domain-containing protein [Ruminococcaceae bacterium]|nr:helix-turn-helix domain-containing protein [Oscillospiraceae bacterium]
MDVLRRINKIRLDKGWSVYRLSLESGIPQSTLTNMFNRETLPSITTLEMICDAFGITMAEFFTEETTEPLSYRVDELEFRRVYGELSDDMKRTVMHLMRALIRNG